MANLFNYRSNRILTTTGMLETISRQQELSNFVVANSDALRTITEINRSDIFPPIEKPERLICEQLVFEGHITADDPFPAFKAALTQMLDFRNDPTLSGMDAHDALSCIKVGIGYQERDCVQDRHFYNSVHLFSFGDAWKISVGFSIGSKLYCNPNGTSEGRSYFDSELARIYKEQIQKESGLFVDRSDEDFLASLKWGDMAQLFDKDANPCDLLDQVKKLFYLFHGSKRFTTSFGHSIMDHRYAQRHAIDNLNKIAERKIQADRYKIEMRCRLTSWDDLEQIRRLSALDEPQIYQVGEWKLKGRDRLYLIVATNGRGHEFIVQSKKPLHGKPCILPSDILTAVETLGIDVNKPAKAKELLRQSGALKK